MQETSQVQDSRDAMHLSHTRHESDGVPLLKLGDYCTVEKITDWQLNFIPARNVPIQFEELYDKSFRLWESVWSRTFAELDGVETLYADDFLRRDEIVVLCHKEEPVALSLFHRLDLRRPAHRADSYFRPFPSALIDALLTRGQHDVLIGSYFTISPTFRKGSLKMPVKEALFGAVTQRFVSSGAQLMLGIMRKDRGMHALGDRFGAQPLLTDICYHNVAVDLVEFTPASAKEAVANSANRSVISELWSRRFDVVNGRRLEHEWFEDFVVQ